MSELRSRAQWGEDILVWDYFHRKAHGFFIEVGANDPVANSQTWLLEQNGWEGILIEPQPGCCERLRRARRRSRVIQAACGAPGQRGPAEFQVASSDDRSRLAAGPPEKGVVITGTLRVEVITLDDVLAAMDHPPLDLVSVDVEGGELDVLRGFDLRRHRPALLILEDYVYDLALHRRARAQGYKLVKRAGSNNWYVPNETPFPVPWRERLELFRKMRLSTALRNWKRRRRAGSA